MFCTLSATQMGSLKVPIVCYVQKIMLHIKLKIFSQKSLIKSVLKNKTKQESNVTNFLEELKHSPF